jgi:hypothetical protein
MGEIISEFFVFKLFLILLTIAGLIIVLWMFFGEHFSKGASETVCSLKIQRACILLCSGNEAEALKIDLRGCGGLPSKEWCREHGYQC